MKKRSFIAIALATLFLGATLSVFSAENTKADGTTPVTVGDKVGANDVTGTFVPD
jgi:2-iminoacetate synthase ThiH